MRDMKATQTYCILYDSYAYILHGDNTGPCEKRRSQRRPFVECLFERNARQAQTNRVCVMTCAAGHRSLKLPASCPQGRSPEFNAGVMNPQLLHVRRVNVGYGLNGSKIQSPDSELSFWKVATMIRGNHLSNTTCITHAFFKNGK